MDWIVDDDRQALSIRFVTDSDIANGSNGSGHLPRQRVSVNAWRVTSDGGEGDATAWSTAAPTARIGVGTAAGEAAREGWWHEHGADEEASSGI